jgi:hypothetical protein
METELLISLHRHWVWADRMREMFEYYLKTEWPILPESVERDQPYMLSSIFTCMCLWYGLLYVTCEGIDEYSDTAVSTVAPEFDSVRNTLRRFRNAMFHVQPKYWSDKLMAVLEDEPIVDSIRNTHSKVGTWLEEHLESYAKQAEQ